MTKFYFWKTRENTGKTWENMQKHGKALDDKVLVQENTGKHRENMGKTWENNEQHWEILDDKVLFWENVGNHQENMGKHAKTWESIG